MLRWRLSASKSKLSCRAPCSANSSFKITGLPVAVLALVLNIGLTTTAGDGTSPTRSPTWRIVEAKNELELRQDTALRDSGEGLSALRQKMHEVEIWARDTFVRRDSFVAIIAEVKSGFNDLGAGLEKRLERMESKIYSKT